MYTFDGCIKEKFLHILTFLLKILHIQLMQNLSCTALAPGKHLHKQQLTNSDRHWNGGAWSAFHDTFLLKNIPVPINEKGTDDPNIETFRCT